MCRRDIYEISPQAVMSNRIDLGLFKNFICSQNLKSIDGPAVINFQYYLKKKRHNRRASINRKIFTLRSYGNFLKLYDVSCADALLFYNSWLAPALFISKKGNRIAIRTMEDNLKKILLQNDFHVPFNVTCHTLRHSMASHLNDKDVDILVIQSILGHLSARSTEPYIHPSQDRIRRAMEKLPGVKFVKELIRKGELNLRFQKPFRSKRE